MMELGAVRVPLLALVIAAQRHAKEVETQSHPEAQHSEPNMG